MTGALVDVGGAGLADEPSIAVAHELVDAVNARAVIGAVLSSAIVDIRLAGVAVVPSVAVARELVDAV